MNNSVLYRLFYRSFKLSEKNSIEPDCKIELPEKNIETYFNTPVSTKQIVLETLSELQSVEASIGYEERLGDFDINNLPLIDVAKYLKVFVFKSPIGYKAIYEPDYMAIYIGSNCSKKTFMHELAHAVDHILPKLNYRTSYIELVAELSAVVLCKIYSIPFSISRAKYYLDELCGSQTDNINNANMINRVVEVVDCIRRCKTAIDSATHHDN
jgi:hypothetical protein